MPDDTKKENRSASGDQDRQRQRAERRLALEGLLP
jgi:hypothetical protein